jgi:1,4-alpha-glucan branching enzyme
VDLGVNAVMPLPFQEYQGENSLGYNGTDLFSPEMDYAVPEAELASYVARVNRLLATKGFGPLTPTQLTGQINQFKAFIEILSIGAPVLAQRQHMVGAAVVSRRAFAVKIA